MFFVESLVNHVIIRFGFVSGSFCEREKPANLHKNEGSVFFFKRDWDGSGCQEEVIKIYSKKVWKLFTLSLSVYF